MTVDRSATQKHSWTMTRGYLVCTLPRSGSNILCVALGSTGALGSPREYFSRERISRQCEQSGTGLGSLLEYIERELPPPAAETGGLLSSKLFWFELEALRARFGVEGGATEVMKLIDRAFGRAAYVRLIRKDKVRQAISYIIAYKSGVWWSLSGDEPQTGVPAPVTFQEIHFWISKLEYWENCWTALLSEYGSRTLTLYYEDLEHDLRGAVAKVAAHLGRVLKDSEIDSVTSPLLRQSNERTELLVSRYVEWVQAGREPRTK